MKNYFVTLIISTDSGTVYKNMTTTKHPVVLAYEERGTILFYKEITQEETDLAHEIANKNKLKDYQG